MYKIIRMGNAEFGAMSRARTPTMQLEQCEYSITGLVKRKLKCALDIQVQSFVYKIKYLAS